MFIWNDCKYYDWKVLHKVVLKCILILFYFIQITSPKDTCTFMFQAEPLIFITLHPLCLKDETVTVFTMDYIMFKSVFPIVMRSKFNKHIYCMQIRYLYSVSLKNRFLCLYLLNNTHFSAQSRLPGEII